MQIKIKLDKEAQIMTSRQFYIILSIFIISLKVQKLPCLMNGCLQNNSYVLMLIYFVIDLLCVLLAFFVLSVMKKHDFFVKPKNRFISVFVKIGLLFISLYFMLQGTLFYEAIQDLFSHVLFNSLPWTVFSLLLTACVFYLAASGITNIARNFELYAFVIFASYIGLAIFGFLRTNFTNIFPLQEICLKETCGKFLDYNIWFGDFFAVLFLGLNAKDIKLKWTMLVYALSAAFVVLLVVEFNGIYLNYASMQPNLIGMLSEQSMLGLDIGRIDWFLILTTEIGTILSCGVCLHFAKNCMSLVIPKVKSNYLLFVLVLLLYLADVIYLVDTNAKEVLFKGFAAILALIVKIATFMFLVILCFYRKSKTKKESGGQKKTKEAHHEV